MRLLEGHGPWPEEFFFQPISLLRKWFGAWNNVLEELIYFILILIIIHRPSRVLYLCGYFPIQNDRKSTSSISSVSILPRAVIDPICWEDRRKCSPAKARSPWHWIISRNFSKCSAATLTWWRCLELVISGASSRGLAHNSATLLCSPDRNSPKPCSVLHETQLIPGLVSRGIDETRSDLFAKIR